LFSDADAGVDADADADADAMVSNGECACTGLCGEYVRKCDTCGCAVDFN